MTISLLYELGEGAPEEALKAGASPPPTLAGPPGVAAGAGGAAGGEAGGLAALALGVLQRGPPAAVARHRLVALAVLEVRVAGAHELVATRQGQPRCKVGACGYDDALKAPQLSRREAAAELSRNPLTSCQVAVRYARVLQQSPAAIPAALAAFLDGRGMGHPAEDLATRACYLFSRLVKV